MDRKIKYIYWVYLMSYLIWSVRGQCPNLESISPCVCATRDDLQIWCTHSELSLVMKGIKKIGSLVQSPIDELIIENNYLPSLPGKTFQDAHILRLMLRHNGIERLSSNWLENQENSLMEIIIIENDLKSIPPESMVKMRNLQAITIESQSMKRLPLFSILPRLKYINIKARSLKTLSKHNFHSLPSLERLYIQGSPGLAYLNENVFYNLPRLRRLEISNSGLQHIHMRAMSLLPALKELSFEGNKLNDASLLGRVTRDLPELTNLNLNKNLIGILNEASFVDIPSLQILSLSENKVGEIHHGAFHRLPNLRTIELNYNRISKIHPESFLQHSSSGVEELSLIGNQITHVSEMSALLETLPSLKFLDLSENRLEEIPRRALRGHPSLERLQLNKNSIKYIEEDAFVAMPSLRELHLSNNSLTNEVEGPLWNLPALKGLDLSNNYFRHLSPKLMYNIASLRRLDMSNNQLVTIDPISFLQTPLLEFVNVSGNVLASIHPATFRNLMHLYELDLSYNRLVEFVPGLPRGIEKLYLKRNQISHLPLPPSPDADLPSLRKLDLTSNSLQNVPGGTFSSMSSLKELYLSKNGINTIEDDSFANLKRLESLDMSRNQLFKIKDKSFQPLRRLQKLNLHGNMLERFDFDTIGNNADISSLDLSKNRLVRINGDMLPSKKLEYLNISMNRMIDFPPAVRSMVNLKSLDISMNQMKKIGSYVLPNDISLKEFKMPQNRIFELLPGTFENINDIESINLEANHIERIHAGAIKTLPNLHSIHLARNLIEELPDESFAYLPKLKLMELQGNRLRHISPKAFCDLPLLQYLNLSNNFLPRIDESGLHNLASLEVLDLSFNRIKSVDASSFELMEWLIELHLDSNQICAIQGKPFEYMPRLKVLSMRNNRLMYLSELSFELLRNNIAIFDIDGNPLACSCRILWLKFWLQEASSIGPRCANGQLVKELPLTRDECSGKDVNPDNVDSCDAYSDDAAHLLSSPLNDRIIDHAVANKNVINGLPTISDTDNFYEDYVDIPENDTTVIQEFPENNDAITDLPTTYAGFMKTKKPEVGNSIKKVASPTAGTSGFTFFGMPLPSVDVSKLLNSGRKVEWSQGASSKYAKSKYDQPKFETGGFTPMLPSTANGFKPIVNPIPLDDVTTFNNPKHHTNVKTSVLVHQSPNNESLLMHFTANQSLSHFTYSNKSSEPINQKNEGIHQIMSDDTLITTDANIDIFQPDWEETTTHIYLYSTKSITTDKPNALSAILTPTSNDIPHQVSGIKRPATITKVSSHEDLPENPLHDYQETYQPVNNRQGKTRLQQDFEPNIQKPYKERGFEWYYKNYNRSDLDPFIGPGVIVKSNSCKEIGNIAIIWLVVTLSLLSTN